MTSFPGRHFSISIVPESQISTVPPPYSPLGISPAKLAYDKGWSSVWTARRLVFVSSGGPFGTAQETRTPSRSRRKSQCRRLASWRWITNIAAATNIRNPTPRREDAVAFEAEVPVQAARVVALDYEYWLLLLSAGRDIWGRWRYWFWCAVGISF